MNLTFPQAIYRPTGLPHYDGNPLIEALGPILSDKEYGKILKQECPYNNDCRNLPAELRVHALDAVEMFFVPLPEHLQLGKTISRMLRLGYVSRNPAAPGFWGGIPSDLKRFSAQIASASPVANTPGSCLVGPSGTGKSCSVKRNLRIYPQVIEHTEYAGKPMHCLQITWMLLECPHDGSIKGLLSSFFAEVDRLLNTDYHRTYGVGRQTTDSMLPGMAAVAATNALGLLVIDEIQNLDTAKSGGREKMLNFFTAISNTLQIPIIRMGTPKALGVLSSEFRSARRATGLGAMVWNRMENGPCWQRFLKALWRYQYTEKEVPLTGELSETLYHECQGIAQLAVSLYSLAQERVIGFEETLTPQLFRETAGIGFKPIQPFIEALKCGDHSYINMQDISFRTLGDHIAELRQNKTLLHTDPIQMDTPPPTLKPKPKSARGKRPKVSSGVIAAAQRAEAEGKNTCDVLEEEGLTFDPNDLLKKTS